MDKILMITPHLSTGGLPQFLLDKIIFLNTSYDIYLVEWDNITGGVLVIQRNKLQNLLGDKLYTLNEDKNKIFDIINKIKPNIIHFEEFPETFIDTNIIERIYSSVDYVITETTHGTSFNPSDKLFFPDKLMLVSRCNYNQYRGLSDIVEVIEYPTKKKRREELLSSLNLDINKKHVLNVGLFNHNKNQSEIFEYAKTLVNKDIVFHFIGNQADNFKDYWGPLLENKPNNCVIWGELDKVDIFYQAMDLFLYTSKLENRPLSVLEALNYDMPILLYNLHNYGDDFSKYENVNFLTSNHSENINSILRILELEESTHVVKNNKKQLNIKSYHILTDVYSEREIKSMQSLSKLENFGIDYNIVLSRRYTNTPPKETCAFPDIVGSGPGTLSPAHYGCYLGHKKAFYNGLNDDPDFMIIFECDCVIDMSHDNFMDKIHESISIIERDDLLMFSFGYHNNQGILEEKSDYFVIDHFIGAHAYIIPKKSYGVFKNLYENTKWNVTDLFYANNLRDYKQGVFKNPITKQTSGLSILENELHDDKY